MLQASIIVGALLCALQAMRATRLLPAALWLAGTSALLALTMYLLGAQVLAVIELSVGAGLVTVLFVFAISVAGEDAIQAPPLPPKPLAAGLVAAVALLIGWFALPLESQAAPAAAPSFAQVFWEVRGLDTLVQVVLIFAGVLGILGLLTKEMVSEPAAPQLREREKEPQEPRRYVHAEHTRHEASPLHTLMGAQMDDSNGWKERVE